MAIGFLVAPAPPRRRWLLAVLGFTVVGALITAMWPQRDERRRTACPSRASTRFTVVYESTTVGPPPAAWRAIDRCLRQRAYGPPHRRPIVLSDVIRWVHEGGPVWFHDETWWFPLTPGRSLDRARGTYLAAPLDGRPCRTLVVPGHGPGQRPHPRAGQSVTGMSIELLL